MDPDARGALRTKDAIRPTLRREFEAETEDIQLRKGAFQDALKKFEPKE